MVDPPDPAAAAPEPADSPARFCADFAALLDARGVSLWAAERSSGWGKTTIAAARKGPELPNVALVLDVLQEIGESETVREQWRDRHRRLSQASATSTSTSTSTSTNEVDDRSRRGADPQATPGEPTPQPAPQPAPQPTPGVPAEPVVSPDVAEVGRPNAADEGEVEPEGVAGQPRRWSRRRVIAASAALVVVLAAAGGLTWWLLVRSDEP